MRWTLVGAKSLLNLRATIASGHWDEFLAHRRATEIREFHPHREAIANHLPVLTICKFAEVRLHPCCHWALDRRRLMGASKDTSRRFRLVVWEVVPFGAVCPGVLTALGPGGRFGLF